MTDRNKWNIVINGGNNINNYESSFQENTSGGVINVGFLKICHICRQTVGLGYSDKCQCEKEDNYCEYCQSSDNNEKKCSCWKKNQEAPENQLLNIQLFTFAETNQIKPILKYQIGKGGYGEVYYGEWKSQEVAVKKFCLSPLNAYEPDLKEIQKEINILKNLRNKYIIQYYGTYSDDQETLIIMDYAENGTLTKFINDNKDKECNWSFNINLIKQMALGLVYIHHENIIHRDLKSMNILLTNNYQVKISDFGLSKIKNISFSQSKSGIAGTLRWMAPEVLREKKISKQSDIYALGMIMWEITAKCTKPFKDVDYNLLELHIINDGKETIPTDTSENIKDIIQRCWKDNPSERISLEKILKIIENDELGSYLSDSKNLPETQSKQFQNFQQNDFSQSVKFSTVEIQKALGEINESEQSYTNEEIGIWYSEEENINKGKIESQEFVSQVEQFPK